MHSQLNAKQKKFCEYYVSSAETFANGVQSYALAYDYDLTDQNKYKSAKTNAYKLMEKPEIAEQIDKLLEAQTLNPQYVQKQLAFLIQQKVNLNVKRQAIADYFKYFGTPQKKEDQQAPNMLSKRAAEMARSYMDRDKWDREYGNLFSPKELEELKKNDRC